MKRFRTDSVVTKRIGLRREEILARMPFPALLGRVVRMNSLGNLSVRIFADGADLEGMLGLYRDPLIKGLTTNPTLMRKAGIERLRSFWEGCA